MNMKRERAPIKKSRLENEVIIAVVMLYVLLSAAMLGIHHVQPDDVATVTSSTSPAHDRPAADTDPTTENAARTLAERAGYVDVRALHRDGAAWHATATKDGRSWRLDLDASVPLVTATPLPR